MNVYKIELLVIDFDQLGELEVKSTIENQRFPNDCISPSVMSIEARVVEWSDAHPLNLQSKQKVAYRELFSISEKSHEKTSQEFRSDD